MGEAHKVEGHGKTVLERKKYTALDGNEVVCTYFGDMPNAALIPSDNEIVVHFWCNKGGYMYY